MTDEITELDFQRLFDAAKASRKLSHAPISHYHVGAALLTKDDRIFTGCNIENSAFCPSICAERVAMFKARSEQREEPVALLVITEDGATSCGVCLQVISELAPNALLIFTDDKQERVQKLHFSDLLTQTFSFKS